MERHKDERKVRGVLDDEEDATTSTATAADSLADSLAEVEIDVEDEEGEKADLSAIAEEDVPGRKWQLIHANFR